MAKKTESTATQTPEMIYPKKISTGTCGLTPALCGKLVADDKKANIPVLRIYGKLSKAHSGVTQYGEFIKYTGEIAAHNLVDNIKARSTAVIFPSGADSFINEVFAKAKAVNPESTVKFGVDITVQWNNPEKGGHGFKWGCKPLMQPDGKDELDLLAESFGEPLLIDYKG